MASRVAGKIKLQSVDLCQWKTAGLMMREECISFLP